MFLQDVINSKLAKDLIIGIWTKRDKNNKVATGSSMSIGCYDKSYDFLQKRHKVKLLNTTNSW